jgi:signal transduction histidine kinase
VEQTGRRLPLLVAIAALSFLAAVVADRLWPDATLVPHLILLWSSAFAALVCAAASRRSEPGPHRSAWAWTALAAFTFFFAQLYTAVAGERFPSAADAFHLAAYPFLLLAAGAFIRGSAPRLASAELRLDLALLTVITGALAFEFMFKPLTAPDQSRMALFVSLLHAAGGIAVLGLFLAQLVARPGMPAPAAVLATLGIITLCVTNLLYSRLAYASGFATPGVGTHLGWAAALLLVAAAAGLAPARPPAPVATPSATAYGVRTIALLLAIAGLATLAVTASLRPPTGLEMATLIGAGMAIMAARLFYAMRRDRRYAAVLEGEVARQTTTLLDSLAATATAERDLRLVMDAVPDVIMLLDREGRVLTQNDPARDWTAGGTVFDLLDANAAAVMREHLRAAFSGHVRRFEVTFVRADRTRVIASILCAPVREGASISKALVLARDITDTRRAETQLRQSEKLVAMGQMVSGVAHEINNPAAIISGFAQTLLLEDLKPDHQDMIRMIHDEASRIGRITGNLLAFARMGSKERALVDLNDLVRRTFALRSYYFTTLNITVNLELDPEGPQVWGHGGDLQQLLLNLLINAEQALTAINGTRRITVRTRSDSDTVSFDCEDTGPGISADIKQRIFDPFFTTKPEGVGTGLGLSICYGIARDHGGRITVESEAGKGATFTVVVPRDPRSQSRPAAQTAAQAQGTLSVLFVDDEAGIRKAVARYLNRRGIQVRAVADGAEGLRLLRTEDFDVIVSDVRMPGMGGREFLAGLKRERPELVPRLVFSSGDVAAADTAALLREAGLPSIVKPFDFAYLEQLIREVAAASSSV